MYYFLYLIVTQMQHSNVLQGMKDYVQYHRTSMTMIKSTAKYTTSLQYITHLKQ